MEKRVPHNKITVSYETVRDIARAAGITSRSQYMDFAKKRNPRDMPADPSKVYPEEWVSWGEFFGTGRKSDRQKNTEFLDYEGAKAYLSPLGFASETEFYAWAKTWDRPEYIPASPRKTYAEKSWVSMGDFLSSGNVHKKEWVSFEEAREYVRGLKLCGQEEWWAWAYSDKRPDNIPSHPHEVYAGRGWVSLPDWLGYGRKSSYGEKVVEHFLKENGVEYRPQYKFEDCRHKRPLAFDFGVLVSGEPVGCIEFHGVQHFEDVEFFNFLHTRKTDEIKAAYCQKKGIPVLCLTYPDLNDLVSTVGGFLNPILGRTDFKEPDRTAAISNEQWMDFEELRAYVRAQALPSVLAYQKWAVKNRPVGCPGDVWAVYSQLGQWVSWVDFLGLSKGCSKITTHTMKSYEECQKWAKENGIMSSVQWWNLWVLKRPAQVPRNPNQFFARKGEWQGWDHFLVDRWASQHPPNKEACGTESPNKSSPQKNTPVHSKNGFRASHLKRCPSLKSIRITILMTSPWLNRRFLAVGPACPKPYSEVCGWSTWVEVQQIVGLQGLEKFSACRARCLQP